MLGADSDDVPFESRNEGSGPWARGLDFSPAQGRLRVPMYPGCPLIHLASAVLSFAVCKGAIPLAFDGGRACNI